MRCRGEVELKSRANAQLEVALAETPRMRCNRGVNQPLLGSSTGTAGVAPERLLLRFLSSNTSFLYILQFSITGHLYHHLVPTQGGVPKP